MNKKERIELFLLKCDDYLVLHESSMKDPTMEHFFIFITKEETKDPIVKEVFSEYEKVYPLIDVGPATLKFMRDRKELYHFVYVDSLDKNDKFYTIKEESLKKNINNILSIRILGEKVDPSTDIEANLNKYFSQFKEISVSAGLLAKEELTEGVKKGVQFIQEKSPIIQENLSHIGKKIGNKLAGFKNKLK